tara:strand:+ start:402 stop:773 length:372 start_codon:yes stop_codon:yes gene_type:complete
MKKVIIDTNAWMAIAEWGINLLEEIHTTCDFPYEICVLDGTITELKKIMEEQRGKFKRGAKLALSLVKALGVKKIKSSGYVDDVLVEYSSKGEIVLTQDAELKRRLSKPYMTIRQKKRVILVK